MKKWKRYPFFLLIVVSSFCYWEYRMLEHMPEKQDSQEISVSTVSRENNKKMASAKEKTAEKQITETAVIQKEPPKEEKENSSLRSFERVEINYLDDALFIGDSRTATLYEYAGWANTDFFVKYGQTVWDVWENTMEGRTLENMLQTKKYGKVYIMLGINELGAGTPDSFAAQFQTVVDKVRELQPEAVVFVESIMHVTAGKDAKGTYINNQEINARNERLKLLADNQNVFYIDENEVMDEPGTGKLRKEYSFDGVHLQVKYIEVWREFLLDHGIK